MECSWILCAHHKQTCVGGGGGGGVGGLLVRCCKTNRTEGEGRREGNRGEC